MSLNKHKNVFFKIKISSLEIVESRNVFLSIYRRFPSRQKKIDSTVKLKIINNREVERFILS